MAVEARVEETDDVLLPAWAVNIVDGSSAYQLLVDLHEGLMFGAFKPYLRRQLAAVEACGILARMQRLRRLGRTIDRRRCRVAIAEAAVALSKRRRRSHSRNARYIISIVEFTNRSWHCLLAFQVLQVLHGPDVWIGHDERARVRHHCGRLVRVHVRRLLRLVDHAALRNGPLVLRATRK